MIQQQLNLLMDNSITLYGASGHAKVIIDILNENKIPVKAVVDDNPKSAQIVGIKVDKTIDFDFGNLENVIISIGNNAIRKKISTTLNTNFSSISHPKAIISKSVLIGHGTVIMAGATVNAATKIGNHCIINTGAIVEHDCNIADFVHISPAVALAGGVKIGEGTHVGINATIIQNVTIGKWVTIGAGAVIIKDVPDFALAVGNPAKIIKYNLEND